MEDLWSKYDKIKEVFYRDFVYDSSYTEQASCIPLSSVKNGVGWVGDGTINLAQYLQFVYTEMILGNKTEDDVRNAILVLTRLADTTYDLFFNSNKGIYFKFEKGFFLRDDIHSKDASKFGLTKISSGYTNGIELKDEDPCFSPFTSQDQIWNLAPILAFLSEKGFEEARQAGYDIFEYVIRNRHKIYNPYYSALLHHWTFLPDMDTDKVKPWDRVSNRNKNLKYKVKVKRGANNWYFSGGFRWAFKKFGGECSTFWHCLWYKPFIFLADRVYHPYGRYFEEQRSGNGAIYHCVKTEIEPGDRIRLFKLMNKIKSDTISQDKINSVLNQLREGTAFNIHTHSSVSFSFSSTSAGYEPMTIWIIFDPYPASEQQGIIYKFQINDHRYVFMFSNRYDGMRDLINNADEDVDCITFATESSIYLNDFFYIFV